jgi:hypothetical protein
MPQLYVDVCNMVWTLNGCNPHVAAHRRDQHHSVLRSNKWQQCVGANGDVLPIKSRGGESFTVGQQSVVFVSTGEEETRWLPCTEADLNGSSYSVARNSAGIT